MQWINRFERRLKALIHRRQLDRDLEDELRFHLEMLGPNRAAAQRRFGNFSRVKEACRDMWTLGSIELWIQDLRYGLRTLRKSPGFTSVAIAALALGIGVNTTVFSLVNGILFKNLPFEHSDRIFFISSTNRSEGGRFRDVSYPDYRDFRAQAKTFDGLAASSQCQGNISDSIGLPQSYTCSQITANTFSVIGQKPMAGRDFTPEDEVPGAPPVVLLTYGIWESRYGKDPSAIGRTIRVNTVPTVIIGVMPRGLRFPRESADFWIPLTSEAKSEDRASGHVLVFGPLAASATLSSARAEMETIAGRLARQYPQTNKDTGTLVQDYSHMAVRRKFRSVFLMMLAAVGFVLLIACANVANLLLSRAVVRSREISIRAALGASRWRVIRQLLIESVLLSVAGGALGWLIAIWGVRAFDLAVTPTGKPDWIDFSIDYHVLLYLSAVSIGTGILFGLVPALRLSKLDVSTSLKEGGRGSGGRRGRYLSGVLVVTEMALAVVLLAGAGLMLRSSLKTYATPVGVNPANVLTMRINLPDARYSRRDDQVFFYERLKARLEKAPGVEVAAIMSDVPGDGSMSIPFEMEGAPPADAGHRPRGGLVVGPDYFRTLQIRLVAGREFTDGDGLAGGPAAIVNQSFANRFWPRENPLGKRVRMVDADVPQRWLTVVGVAPDILQNNSGNLIEHGPLLYLPYRERPRARMFVAARTRVTPASLGDTFRRVVQSMDEDLPVSELATLESQLALRSWTLAVFGGMFGIFGAIAFLLASVGLYAVIAHSVNQRTQEIGVRLSMGATARDILRLVFAQGMTQLAIGLGIGLAAALAVTQVMNDLLVGVSPQDPLTFVSVSLVLTAAGILGCAIPARRAIRVDPAITLRHE